jgi:hypothetical protein
VQSGRSAEEKQFFPKKSGYTSGKWNYLR